MRQVFAALSCAALLFAPLAAPAEEDDASAQEEAFALVEFMAQPWTGDLDGMVERGFIRLGVPYGVPFLTYDQGRAVGLSADLAAEFEKHLRAKLGKPARNLTVALAPLPRDRMFDALVEGRIDLLAAGLTITGDRETRVDFAAPVITGVDEVIVTGPESPRLESLEDLVDVALHVRPSSSYAEHLRAINAARTAAGQTPLNVVEADENLEDVDLAELVSVGVIPAIVMDAYKADLYAKIFEGLVVHPDLKIAENREIAWAMRKGSPKLLDAANGFMKVTKKGTQLGNILIKRWLRDADRVKNAMAPGEDEKFQATIELIRQYAGAYAFDPIMIAAQGYQESGLDQRKRSRAGAVGIMQVMPRTAKDPNVGIPDIHVADRNVEAGVKYLRFLRNRYFSDPEMSELDQTLFAFAAYNAGPGNISKARKRAVKMGLDPNLWFGNVELATARAVSQEPVVYVRNILKYYTTYTLASMRRQPRG